MSKKQLPTVEQVEQAEDVLDEIEGFWHHLTKTFRVYSGKGDGAFLVLPKKPCQTPR